MNKSLIISVIAVCGSLALASPAAAEMMTFNAELKGSSEVPPADSAATGTAMVTVDTTTKKVTWEIKHSGLSGDAVAAHIHGPADETQAAGPLVDLSANVMTGSADITDAQIADVQAGKTYVNVHTAKFPDGEIRGQLKK
jgi:CHRD domain